MEFEYRRGGTLAYLAAYDVHAARLFGQVAETTGIVPFMALVDQVMNSEPYCSARRAFWIVDSGSSHNGQRSIDRMSAAWPNATLVHLPVHTSWLDQIEVCSRSSSASHPTGRLRRPRRAGRPAGAVRGPLQRHRRPFDWRFTTTDLARLLERLDAHQRDDLAGPLAA